MMDIQVDENGDLRCANCGGKHFTEKRTTRAKLAGGGAAVLTVGVAGAAAPLATKKKLQCKLCGTYNKQGNAQPFTPAAAGRPNPKARPEKKEMSDNETLISFVMLTIGAFIGVCWAISAGTVGWGIAAGLFLLFMLAATAGQVNDMRNKPDSN
ncbi:hypothetical protein [Gordonia sp. MMO-8]|uniref:hypothetical protein n=1 Tax=Gordonia sp. MMO-8 TaxID=3127886 RepID=UPI0030160C9E